MGRWEDGIFMVLVVIHFLVYKSARKTFISVPDTSCNFKHNKNYKINSCCNQLTWRLFVGLFFNHEALTTNLSFLFLLQKSVLLIFPSKQGKVPG